MEPNRLDERRNPSFVGLQHGSLLFHHMPLTTSESCRRRAKVKVVGQVTRRLRGFADGNPV